MTVATAASRVTGFIRVVVVASALGTTFLANTYQSANTVPNVLFELLAAGVLTSVFVPTFVSYLVAGREEEGWDAANALASVALVGLIGLSLLLAFGAPIVMRLLTLGVEDPELRRSEIAVGSSLLRLFSPQVALYGAGMIMTGALHAHRRFALPAIAPIFNNVVVICVYLVYAAMRGDRLPAVGGITAAETFVLGAGTTLGVVAMTICLLPQLSRLGWRFRWRFDPGHPAVKKGVRLGVWALGYAGGYQASLIVVLLLANKVEGGVAAYQWAYAFFYMPHALFAVPIFNVLFTALSEHVARAEEAGVAERMRDGLGMLVFILLPVAAMLAVAAHPLAEVTLHYGVMTGAGAALVARVLIALAVGLPAYSVFLVFTRAFYARGDTKTPTLVNAATVAASSCVGAVLFFALDPAWAVAGLAFGHSISFVCGSAVLGRILSRRVGAFGGTRLDASLVRSGMACVAATGVMFAVGAWLPDAGRVQALVELAAIAIAGSIVYLGVGFATGSPELVRLKSSLIR